MQLSRTTSERQNLGKLKFLKLYDMEADPNEIKDVSEENPNVKIWTSWMKRTIDTAAKIDGPQERFEYIS